jgi:hypothetical protein
VEPGAVALRMKDSNGVRDSESNPLLESALHLVVLPDRATGSLDGRGESQSGRDADRGLHGDVQ